jgi:hypothetical protein
MRMAAGTTVGDRRYWGSQNKKTGSSGNFGKTKDKRTGIIVGAQAPAPPFSHNQTKQQTTKKDRHHRWHGSSRTRASSAPHPQDGPRDNEALQRCDYLEEVASGTK